MLSFVQPGGGPCSILRLLPNASDNAMVLARRPESGNCKRLRGRIVGVGAPPEFVPKCTPGLIGNCTRTVDGPARLGLATNWCVDTSGPRPALVLAEA
ncbi:MAG: hypothetical protein WB761_22695 [Solirubrobacteraceae bacterium]